MFRNIYPVFEIKRLLKKEMLENLRDYPRNLFRIQCQGYCDGVLWGCDLEASDNGLKVLPGILCYKGIPYFQEEPCMVPCKANGKEAYLKVRFLDKTIGAEQEEYLSQVYADEQAPEPNYELELGRFKLQPGARLRTEYTGFHDYATEFDTVNRICVPYAALGRQGIWPQLLKCFAGEMMRLRIQDPWDCAFCLNSLQLREAMPYEAVRAYLNVRLGQEGEYTNEQVYNALKRILREAEGKEERPRRAENKEKKLLML